ncbi:MAG: pentapeptide repeat-containing protein [Gammaproteobacteria bacterium]
MKNYEPVQLIRSDIVKWNTWRADNPQRNVDLSSANLSWAKLSGADFSGVELRGADLSGSDLSWANLSGASLGAADLSEADLSGADLMAANLVAADLEKADLSESDLSGANLSGAILAGADLSGADLSRADLSRSDIRNANLSRVDLTDALLAGTTYTRHTLQGKCSGSKIESCSGNPIFKRDVGDQQYIDALEAKLGETFGGKIVFTLWKSIDFGRSFSRVALGACFLSVIFGAVFWVGRWKQWGLLDYSGSADSWFTPFYYSLLTYTTLGFCDVTPAGWIGEFIIVIEVILGYGTLGLLIAVLANKVARRG